MKSIYLLILYFERYRPLYPFSVSPFSIFLLFLFPSFHFPSIPFSLLFSLFVLLDLRWSQEQRLLMFPLPILAKPNQAGQKNGIQNVSSCMAQLSTDSIFSSNIISNRIELSLIWKALPDACLFLP